MASTPEYLPADGEKEMVARYVPVIPHWTHQSPDELAYNLAIVHGFDFSRIDTDTFTENGKLIFVLRSHIVESTSMLLEMNDALAEVSSAFFTDPAMSLAKFAGVAWDSEGADCVPGSAAAHSQVIAHLDALQFMLDHGKGGNELTLDTLLVAHKKLFRGATVGGKASEAGVLRRRMVSAGTHTFPSAGHVPDLLPPFLRSLEEEIRDPAVPIWAVASHAFFDLVQIHPFWNGNGRTSRLITAYVFARRSVPVVVPFGPSELRKKSRKEYIRSIRRQQDRFFHRSR
jgi:Fic family protein